MKNKQRFGPCTLETGILDCWNLRIPLHIVQSRDAKHLAGDQKLLIKELFYQTMGHDPWHLTIDETSYLVEFPSKTRDEQILKFVDLLHQNQRP